MNSKLAETLLKWSQNFEGKRTTSTLLRDLIYRKIVQERRKTFDFLITAVVAEMENLPVLHNLSP